MELSHEEIGYVKFFLHKKKHFYFEVQVEVMDHFFSVLEEEKPKYPSMVFSDLISLIYDQSAKDLISIETSLKNRLQTKYNKVFLKEFVKPFSNKYLALMALSVFAFFNLQVLLHEYISPQGFYLIVGILNLIVLFKYMAPSDLLLGNYLTEKISGNYGMVPWVFSAFSYLFIEYTAPIFTASGFNITYLITAIALVIKSLLINAIIQTGKVGVNECLKFEPASEALNA
ncbi:MAG: hypothetical protein EOP00_10310 [Pedobacter sp.]|nr:MAG: hypothetical protein EOP00_10310 [Pedobacter sp.]